MTCSGCPSFALYDSPFETPQIRNHNFTVTLLLLTKDVIKLILPLPYFQITKVNSSLAMLTYSLSLALLWLGFSDASVNISSKETTTLQVFFSSCDNSALPGRELIATWKPASKAALASEEDRKGQGLENHALISCKKKC